jgi:hypothetical protein
VALGDYRVCGDVWLLNLQEGVQTAYGNQPTIDRGRAVVLLLTVIDICINISQRDFTHWFIEPAEEQLKVVHVVGRGGRMGIFAPQVILELSNY